MNTHPYGLERRAAVRPGLSDKAQGDTAGEGEDRAEDDKPRQWLDGFFHGGSGNAGGVWVPCVQQDPGQAPGPLYSGDFHWSGQKDLAI
ncbi:fumarate reductase/succinate dehydrogenase flavoprotein-like protein [Pseudomonas chlororaphis subsp. aurantiaca]|nr:fumarate reductase/succinate dehydrogenase flavoprotein-like protein [Pseudomonas chlororaphis subsp. aurantiaca]